MKKNQFKKILLGKISLSNYLFILLFATSVSLMIFQIANQNQQQQKNSLGGDGSSQPSTVSPVPYDIVFVTRQIVKHGAKDMDTLTDMPGVGPHSRFRDCAPGKLLKYRSNGKVVVLIDGSNPTPATLNLIDVNAPDVSYDGSKIVFAGLPSPPTGHSYDTLPREELGAWRIYRINVNGTGLVQLTNSNFVIDNTQFNTGIPPFNDFSKYDDIDPIWLPDGRICFSSSRYPATAEYGGARTTNLYIMKGDGTNLHRITSERNGAERPVVDPLTGQIVFARWWRNGRFPIDNMTTVPNASGTGYLQKDGLSSDGATQSVSPNFIRFNGWVAAAINPDGTGLHLFSGGRGDNQEFMMYGGSFTSTNDIVTNYFPENKLTPEGGFGGINKHVRGAGVNVHIAGLTYDTDTTQLNYPPGTPDSLKRYFPINGFASDASVLPDDRIIISWAPNYNQDYGLYVIDANGSNRTLIYDVHGTTQLRAKAIRPRTLPPVIHDQVTNVVSLYPPLAAGPYNIDGSFTFNCLNVYANGPVDMDITSAVGIGTAGSIRFFINQQRTRKGSDSELDWPILLAELTIPSSGAVSNPNSPANVSLFEQLRTSAAQGYVVPSTGMPFPNSTAHVAGMNYGRPNQMMTCVGCHRGHSMIPVPANPNDAEFTNLAPGATVTISSGQSILGNFLTDRQVMLAFNDEHYWFTQNNMTQNQWAKLTFPVSVKIKNVRLYNIPLGGAASSSLQIHQAQVNLYADANATQLVGTQTISQDIAVTGTDAIFSNVVAKCVEVKILNITGTFNGHVRAGLAEIEVIASGKTTPTPRISANDPEVHIQTSVAPNPFMNVTRLTLQGDNAKISYLVYNLSGEIILSKELNIKKDIKTDETIDLSKYPVGIYMIKIQATGFQKVLKLIKM